MNPPFSSRRPFFGSLGPAAALCALSGLSGCNVGPNAKGVSAQRGGLDGESGWTSDVGAAGLKTSPADISKWWATLGDPQLDSLIVRAIGNNKDLALAKLRLAEARALRGVVAADGLPQVDAKGNYSRLRDSEETVQRFGNENESGRDNWNAGFDASWELDIFGRVRRNVQAADADVDVQVESVRDVLVSLTADVGRAYVELRSFQERLAIVSRNIVLQADAVSLAQSRFDAGLTSELDVAQAQTLLASTKATIPPFEASVAASMHRIGVLLGLDPGALKAELAETKPVPLAGTGVAALKAAPIGKSAEMLMRRPDLRAAERRIAAATARIGVATTDLYPRVTLLGLFAFAADDFSNTFDMNARQWSIGPSVRWNIFDGGRIRANISTLEVREQQQFVTYERAVLSALEEAETAIVSYAKSQQRRDRVAAALEFSRRTVELSDIQYKAGRVGFLNVIESQRALLAIEDNLAEADRTVTLDLIRVYKAVGGGWE